MTTYEMLEKLFKQDLSDKYPQYRKYIEGKVKVKIVQANRSYSVRGRKWYDKDDLMLAFGGIEQRPVWNRKTRAFDKVGFYMVIYSANEKGLCLAPYHHLTVVEVCN